VLIGKARTGSVWPTASASITCLGLCLLPIFDEILKLIRKEESESTTFSPLVRFRTSDYTTNGTVIPSLFWGESDMAKTRSEVNKSEAIRGAFDELPNAKAKEIVAHLKAKGIDVTESLVYAVKKGIKKKKPGRKAGTVLKVKAVVAAPSSNGVLYWSLIVLIKFIKAFNNNWSDRGCMRPTSESAKEFRTA